MSHTIRYLFLIILLAAFQNTPTPAPTPQFHMWFECVQRGPYEGMAMANIGYSYDGEFELSPEDSRMFGDTITGETVVYSFTAKPGEHPRAIALNVGALRVITWKVIFFGKIHTVTVYDNPEIPDCSWDLKPAETPDTVSNV